MSLILKGIDIHEKFESARLILERNERDGTIRVINESSGEYIGHAIQIDRPHGRLIDGDELKKRLYGYERWTGIDEAPYEYAEKEVYDAPTILEAEE